MAESPDLSCDSYDYSLPSERIRLVPPEHREESRLLVAPRNPEIGRDLSFRRVFDLPGLLAPGDRLVVNDSRVVPARIRARVPSGRQVELLVLGPFENLSSLRVRFLAKGLGKASRLALFSGRGEIGEIVFDETQGSFSGEYRGERGLSSELEAEGEMPLPPYIARMRPADASDRERYQTVYSRVPGSVAAPTAGLHLGAGLMKRLEDRGIKISTVTLHVGLGTFRPLTPGPLSGHRMHSEWFEVPERTAREIAETRSEGGRIVAVGTTALRTLESACQRAGEAGGIRACSGWTDLFIRPGHVFGCADGLLTNFHTPRSTLLVLVDAFLGGDGRWREIYDRALREGFFFLSYGDAMLIL